MFMIKCFSVKFMLFHFSFFVWTQAAETLKDQLTDLGQNVTINCDLDVKEVYWFFLKLPRPPVLILRTLPSGAFHHTEQFRHKYSVQSKHHLFINNVTQDELGVFYCMNTDITHFSNGARLHIVDSIPSINGTVMKSQQQNGTAMTSQQQNLTQWLVIMSGLMNGVLIVVVLVVTRGSRRTSQNSKNAQDDLQKPQVIDLEQPQDSDQSQYEEGNYTTQCHPIPLESTYALAQIPKSQT